MHFEFEQVKLRDGRQSLGESQVSPNSSLIENNHLFIHSLKI